MAQRNITITNKELLDRARASAKANTRSASAPMIDIGQTPVQPGAVKAEKDRYRGAFDKNAKDAQGLTFEARKVLRARGLTPGTEEYNKAAGKFAAPTVSEQQKAARMAQVKAMQASQAGEAVPPIQTAQSAGPGMTVDPNAPVLGRPSSASAGQGRSDVATPKSLAARVNAAEAAGTVSQFAPTASDPIFAADTDFGSTLEEKVVTQAVDQVAQEADPFAITPEQLIEGEFADLKSLAEQYGLDPNIFPKDLQDQINQALAAQAEQVASQERTAGVQQELESIDAEAPITAQRGQEAAAIAQLAPGREGAVGTGRFGAMEDLKTATSNMINRKNLALTESRVQREEALNALKEAEKSGQAELIQSAQSAIANAEFEIAKAETEYVNALTMASEEERNVAADKRASLKAFTDVVDMGTELSVQGISDFANQLGVDFETAYGYYSGAQAIRDDKSLDLATKQTQLAQLQSDFNDQLAGLSTKEAKAVDDYLKLVQSGQYSEEQLQSFAVNMGIPDERNPVFQAELAVAQAEANIKNKEAQGIPVTQSDWATYYDNIAAQNEVFGTGGEAYIPNNSLEGITSEYAGGRLNIATDTPYQCGEFVNRFWGLASGGSGGFGSTYQSKKDIVNNRGIIAGSVDINNYTSILKPGMAFVSQAGDTGHVGIITQVLPDGRFMTMEANIGDDNVNTPDVPIPNTRSIKDADIYGYAAPPGDYSIAGQDATGLADSFITAVSSIGFASVAQSEVAANEIQKLVSSGQYEKAKDYLLTQVKNSSSATERGVLDGKENTIAALNNIQEKLDEFEAKGGDTNIFTGLSESALQKGGLTSDPELANIANSIAIAIVDYRRAISGAAFTESEAAAYDQIFPSTGKTSELNQAKINSVTEKLNADLTGYYRSRLGGSVYDEIFMQAESSTATDYTSDWQLFTPVEEELDGIL